jgi:hypothetical protein
LARHELTLGWAPEAKDPVWPDAGALVAQTDAETFLVAGTGIVLTLLQKTTDRCEPASNSCTRESW